MASFGSRRVRGRAIGLAGVLIALASVGRAETVSLKCMANGDTQNGVMVIFDSATGDLTWGWVQNGMMPREGKIGQTVERLTTRARLSDAEVDWDSRFRDGSLGVEFRLDRYSGNLISNMPNRDPRTIVYQCSKLAPAGPRKF